MARHSITVAFAAWAAACSSGQPSKGSPFPSTSLGGATQPVVDDADEDDDGESGSSGGKGSDETGGTSGDPFGDADTSATAMTSGGPGDSSGGVGTTTSAGDESTGGFMPGNGQPAMGMYAECFEPDLANCNAFAPVCLMIDQLMSGFCTHDMCSVPADCNAAPLDATATPICVEGESPRGQDVGLCALDCSGGRTCPAGMQCIANVSFGEGFPSYDFCN